MGHEGAAEPAGLLPELHELAQGSLGILEPAFHRPRVELLEFDLDLFERVQISLQHPIEEVAEELEAFKVSRVPGSASSLTESLDDGNVALVRRDHPALRHEAAKALEPVRAVSRRRNIGRDMDIRAEIAEERLAPRPREPLSAQLVELERLDEPTDVLLVGPLQVDPEDRGAAEAPDRSAPVVDLLHLVSVEEERRHCVRVLLPGRHPDLGEDVGEHDQRQDDGDE